MDYSQRLPLKVIRFVLHAIKSCAKFRCACVWASRRIALLGPRRRGGLRAWCSLVRGMIEPYIPELLRQAGPSQLENMGAGRKSLHYRDAGFCSRGGVWWPCIVGPPKHGAPGGSVVFWQRAFEDSNAVGEVPILRLNNDPA